VGAEGPFDGNPEAARPAAHVPHRQLRQRGGGRTRTRPLPVCEGRGADGPQAAVWAGTTARLPGTHRRVHKQGHPDGGSVPAPRGSRGGGGHRRVMVGARRQHLAGPQHRHLRHRL